MLLLLQQNMLLGEAATLVEVPDVVGQTQANGTTTLETALFVVAVQTGYSNAVPAGSIISQSPTAGSMALEGSTVTITVSLGAQTVVPAGRSRKRRGQRYFVEIDGQQFLVDSQQQAQALLERARALAERESEKAAEQVVQKFTKKARIPEVRLETPVVSVSPELEQDLSPLIADIQRLYERAAATAEIRLRMERIAQDDDDEDELLLLL